MNSAILSRPRVLLVVRVILLHKNSILLIQRSKNDSSDPLKWEIPGGKLDKGQDLNEAAERELIEEVGLFAKPLKQLVFFDSDIDHNTKYKGIPYIRLTALYKSETTSVRLSEEHDDYKWLSIEECLKMDLTEFTRKSLLAWEKDITEEIQSK
jgi:8-oxo-dGTP diphosphatase